MAMIVGSLRVRLLLRQSRSLKDKRQVVRSIKDRLRNQFPVSVAEVEDEENCQVATLGIALVGNEFGFIQGALDQIVQALRGHPIAEFLEHRMEVLKCLDD